MNPVDVQNTWKQRAAAIAAVIQAGSQSLLSLSDSLQRELTRNAALLTSPNPGGALSAAPVPSPAATSNAWNNWEKWAAAQAFPHPPPPPLPSLSAADRRGLLADAIARMKALAASGLAQSVSALGGAGSTLQADASALATQLGTIESDLEDPQMEEAVVKVSRPRAGCPSDFDEGEYDKAKSSLHSAAMDMANAQVDQAKVALAQAGLVAAIAQLDGAIVAAQTATDVARAKWLAVPPSLAGVQQTLQEVAAAEGAALVRPIVAQLDALSAFISALETLNEDIEKLLEPTEKTGAEADVKKALKAAKVLLEQFQAKQALAKQEEAVAKQDVAVAKEVADRAALAAASLVLQQDQAIAASDALVTAASAAVTAASNQIPVAENGQP